MAARIETETAEKRILMDLGVIKINAVIYMFGPNIFSITNPIALPAAKIEHPGIAKAKSAGRKPALPRPCRPRRKMTMLMGTCLLLPPFVCSVLFPEFWAAGWSSCGGVVG
ncbi:hypothetical protein MAPG_05047 [Magnaporthiopsis poae ATCC 64411]|uniref:Uncharacterized protein n=1 Tax=Magnaporthiopsis poae (strain ATCC 64411 / 73-15) TaxID=644358 RepID=A0A0C4DYC9_MAGP6|nr:hypothetical protein MAPG_05047 [Magnaporthiopsis poae ATCC 64411]